MSTLRAAAQAVLDRWDSPRWEWHQGPTAALMADLRAALAAPNAEYERGVIDGVQRQAQSSVDRAVNRMAALAEPVQEPVAWRWGYRSVTTGEMDWRGYVEIAADPNLRSPEIIMQPLYAAPPQRKPLTDEEINELLRTMGLGKWSVNWLCRAVEKAHRIE